MLFLEEVISSYMYIVSLSFRGQHGSNTVAQSVIEPRGKRQGMKVIAVSSDTVQGVKICPWDIS